MLLRDKQTGKEDKQLPSEVFHPLFPHSRTTDWIKSSASLALGSRNKKTQEGEIETTGVWTSCAAAARRDSRDTQIRNGNAVSPPEFGLNSNRDVRC